MGAAILNTQNQKLYLRSVSPISTPLRINIIGSTLAAGDILVDRGFFKSTLAITGDLVADYTINNTSIDVTNVAKQNTDVYIDNLKYAPEIVVSASSFSVIDLNAQAQPFTATIGKTIVLKNNSFVFPEQCEDAAPYLEEPDGLQQTLGKTQALSYDTFASEIIIFTLNATKDVTFKWVSNDMIESVIK